MPNFYTLKKRDSFIAARHKGRAVFSKGIVIQVVPKTTFKETFPENHIIVGFTATKKVGNAVKRNFCKRRMREIARRVLSEIYLKNADYIQDNVFIFISKYNLQTVDYAIAQNSCQKSLLIQQ